jgi:hypothetical protein
MILIALSTYLDACNFNQEAILDNGLCNWDCFGCMDNAAQNYNPEATVNTGECLYCTNDNDQETSCVGDLNDDGIRGTADLLSLLSYFGMLCEE